MEFDPIVEEIREIRDAHAREHGYDIESIVRSLIKEQDASGREVVCLPPKRLSERHIDRKAG